MGGRWAGIGCNLGGRQPGKTWVGGLAEDGEGERKEKILSLEMDLQVDG